MECMCCRTRVSPKPSGDYSCDVCGHRNNHPKKKKEIIEEGPINDGWNAYGTSYIGGSALKHSSWWP